MAAEQEERSWLQNTRQRWKPRIDQFKRGWRRFSQHRMGVAGLVIIAVFVIWALFPDVFAPHSLRWKAYIGVGEGRMTLAQIKSLPHPPAFGDPFFAPLGTTELGYDVMTQVIHSADTALFIGFAAGILSSLVGVPLGLISGFYGDTAIDELIQRAADVGYSLPFLPLVIVFVAAMGVSTFNIIIAIVIKSWINNCIIIRGETLSLKERAYVDSARVAGASDARIVFRHILPNVLPLSFIYLAQDAAAAILVQANLAFLGLADPTTLSWGIMLQEVNNALTNIFTAPWWFIPPGVMIALLAAAFYFIGYSMEDVANPERE